MIRFNLGIGALGEMKTDIKLNLLYDSIIVNTFEKVIKFEIKNKFFSGDISCLSWKIENQNFVTESIKLYQAI